MVLEQLDVCIQKYKLSLCIILYTKLSWTWITDPNIKHKTIEILKENIGDTPWCFTWDKEILNKTPKTWLIKEKLINWSSSKNFKIVLWKTLLRNWREGRQQKQEELQSCSLWSKNHIHSKIDKMKRQRVMYQMKEQDKTPEKQLNEVEIGNLSEKEFRIMIVKMIQDLGKRMEAKIRRCTKCFTKTWKN